MTFETPIACALDASDYRKRAAWIDALNRKNLRRREQDDLTLRLLYEPSARAVVEKLVEQERACCAFLDFRLADCDGLVELTVSASERARAAAEVFFAAFMPATVECASSCRCC